MLIQKVKGYQVWRVIGLWEQHCFVIDWDHVISVQSLATKIHHSALRRVNLFYVIMRTELSIRISFRTWLFFFISRIYLSDVYLNIFSHREKFVWLHTNNFKRKLCGIFFLIDEIANVNNGFS